MENFITKRNDDSNNWIWNDLNHKEYWVGLYIKEDGHYWFSYLKVDGYKINRWYNRHSKIVKKLNDEL